MKVVKSSRSHLFLGDSLHFLRQFPTGSFQVASFSPPYGTGQSDFHVENDFWEGGAFFPYMMEIARVADVVAINLSQLVVNKRLVPYLEEFTVDLNAHDITLFDRWVITKPFTMPRRGNRALTRFEFVLLYTRHPHDTITMYNQGSTVLEVSSHNTSPGKGVGVIPYYPEIPRQVISMYCPAGGKVLDPFAGTGTTLVEGIKQEMIVYGIELQPVIFDQMRENVEEAERVW